MDAQDLCLDLLLIPSINNQEMAVWRNLSGCLCSGKGRDTPTPAESGDLAERAGNLCVRESPLSVCDSAFRRLLELTGNWRIQNTCQYLTWHFYSLEWYSEVKSNELSLHESTWKDLKSKSFSKNTTCKMTYTVWYHWCKKNRRHTRENHYIFCASNIHV